MITKARRWLFWSPANFWTGVSLAVVGAVLLGVSWTLVLPGHHKTDSVETKKPTVAGYVLTDPTATPSVAPATEAEREITATADKFTRTWLDKRDGWWLRVRPLITLDLRATMKTTSVPAIPDTTLRAVRVDGYDDNFATANVTLTDGTVITAGLSSDGVHGWRVSSFNPKADTSTSGT